MTGSRIEVLTYPDDRLTTVCRAVEQSEIESLQPLIEDMFYTMFYMGGVGLAAPQVGANLRLFIIDQAYINGNRRADPWVFINPEIVSESDEQVYRKEGCLSFPGTFMEIQRPQWVTLKALDRHGNEFSMDGAQNDLFSLAMQHELDHLNGVVMLDRADGKKQKGWRK